MSKQNGYFLIGVENPKKECNIGSLWRTAHNFGASSIFTIGLRYKIQKSDTTKAFKHVPLIHYINLEDFNRHIPINTPIIGVEFPHDKARSLINFIHPKQAIYLLGTEDRGLSKEALSLCQSVVYIPCQVSSLNLSIAGSIVIYDRLSKKNNFESRSQSINYKTTTINK